MGIEEVSTHKVVQTNDSTTVASIATQQDKKVNVDFSQARAIGTYEQNNVGNSFLREYLYGKAAQQGVNIPKGLSINISSPSSYSNEFKELLGYVRKDIYGARVLDMFNLLVQDKNAVEKRVANMKISDADKNKILQLKTQFDQYYHVEANYNGQSFDLVNLSDEDVQKLAKISPEFAQFAINEKATLKKHVADFARGEIESVELAEAAEDSKKAVPILLGVLGVLGAKEIISTYSNRHAMKVDPKAFLKAQKALSRQKVFKLVNPLSEIKNACKGKKGWMALAAMAPILLNTLAGSIDDISGAGKDLFQDKDCFGWGPASAIGVASVVGGVGTSFAIAGIYERARDVLIARRTKLSALKTAATESGKLERFNQLRKVFRPSRGQRMLRGGKFAIAGALFGMVVASCTSGSSWTSMIGTRWMFGRNGDKLEAKNIISAQENTVEGANKNMMKYEAYSGKWRGIAPVRKEDGEWKINLTSDQVIGGVLGGTGLLTHPSSMVANSAFTAQGCSETLTACAYQLLGNSIRGHKLEEQKEALVASVQNNNVPEKC